MVRIAVLGCGRIGRMHAANVAAHPRARLAGLYDIDAAAAAEVGAAHGVTPAGFGRGAAGGPGGRRRADRDGDADACGLIEAAVAAGKAVLCEKPIDLDLARVERCRDGDRGSPRPGAARASTAASIPGTGRRARRWRRARSATLHQVVITSRDPGMPPRSYYEVAGGLFRDMTIHDFDLARFMLGDEPVEVFAIGGRLIDPATDGASSTTMTPR